MSIRFAPVRLRTPGIAGGRSAPSVTVPSLCHVTGPSSTTMTSEICEGSAIEANRFSTSTCSNLFDAGDPDDVGVRRQHIAVNLDVHEMLGRLGTGQQPGDQDEERQHVSACRE